MLLQAHARTEARVVIPAQESRAARPGRRAGIRRRDRHGRGLRGPLAPAAVPLSQTRAERFDEMVAIAWDRLAARRSELTFVELAVADVPAADDPGLARFDPPSAGIPARLTVYRRPLELRCESARQVRALTSDVLAEQAGGFLGVRPHDLDPEYGRG